MHPLMWSSKRPSGGGRVGVRVVDLCSQSPAEWALAFIPMSVSSQSPLAAF